MHKNLFHILLLVFCFGKLANANNTLPSHNEVKQSIVKKQAYSSQLKAIDHLHFNVNNQEIEVDCNLDIEPLFFDDKTSNNDVLLRKSLELWLLQKQRLLVENRNYFNKHRVKEALFPFHSFW
ncbi:hypothetical protein [Lacinutrix chionoecetis]